MIGDFRSSRRLRITLNNPVARVSRILVVLSLAFVLTGIGRTTSVEAAPAADTTTITTFAMKSSPLPTPLCAHTHYSLDISVEVSAVTNLSGNSVQLVGGSYPSNIKITGESSSNDIAEVNPSAITGSPGSNWTGLRHSFDVQTHDNIGSATLTVQGTVEWAGQKGTVGPLTIPITVVHCRYKIVLMSIVTGGFPGTTLTVPYRVTSEISVGAHGGNPQGEAPVSWTPKRVADCYSGSFSILTSPATISGLPSADGQTITITVDYDQTAALSDAKLGCGAKGSASATVPFQPPSVQFVVPATGGAQSTSTSLDIGNAGMMGTATIFVVPVKNE